jgi:hypothetical protein
MTRLWRSMRLAVLALAGLLYVVMDYLASSSHQPPLCRGGGAAPLTLGLLTAGWNSRFRWPAMLLWLLVLLALL